MSSDQAILEKKVLIIGVGNPFRQDDGIGPLLIENLKSKNLPDYVDLLDGGTDGLSLIENIKEYSECLIIDAVNMSQNPGVLKVFTSKEATLKINSDSLSTHGFGIAEVISMIEALEIKSKITIIGIQPESVDYAEGLTDSLSPNVNKYIETIMMEIKKLK
jgi:hydrogenase maturation protease